MTVSPGKIQHITAASSVQPSAVVLSDAKKKKKKKKTKLTPENPKPTKKK